MFSRALFYIYVLVTAQRVVSFIDECNTDISHGVMKKTENLVVDTSVVQPITDPHRYFRHNDDVGFVRYASDRGFDSLNLTGYVYFNPENNTQWGLEIVSGENEQSLSTLVRLNKRTLPDYELPWTPPPATETKWHQFFVNFTLTDCPHVIEIRLRGYASENMIPGWGVQVGQVGLAENLFTECKIPLCHREAEANCSVGPQDQRESIEIEDTFQNFSHVYIASDNMLLESANAISSFNGDDSRLRRNTNKQGVLTYAIEEGIASIEVTLYRCETRNSTLTIKPYYRSGCEPIILEPELAEDSYHSECWHRYKVKVEFKNVMQCPPPFVSISITGRHDRALQIAHVVLTGYGPTIQDRTFQTRRNIGTIPEEESEVIQPEDSSDSETSSGMVIWIVITVLSLLILLLIIAAVIMARNDKVKEYIKDFISERYPTLYDYIYPSAQTRSAPKPGTSRKKNQDSRTFGGGSQSLNMGSLTFDRSLKRMREPASRGPNVTRDGFGEQLIDLSKHLHRTFWTSKVGGKSPEIEIEERLGKGGFGKVWKARWQGTLVALKVVPIYGSLTGEEKATRMAIMEAALSGCLAHPNIVSTYTCEIREATDIDMEMQGRDTFGDKENNKWMTFERFAQTNASRSFLKSKTKTDLEVRMVMEYCDRGSLVEAIRKGWFKKVDNPEERDFEAIILTALDIARGLGCLHQNSIIHGDLKPHNVLLQNKPFVDTRGFIAKIADFGLSIHMEQEQSHVDGMRMGTGGYVSPEVAVRGKILPASDIYSYGILLWELFTGELIQDALKDAPKVSSRLTMGSWRPIFQEDCPRPYWRLASMCWNDFPDWRPTLEYIIDELNDMLKTIHDLEKPNPPSESAVEDE